MMHLSDLAEYAERKYQIKEESQKAFEYLPGYTVLNGPKSGKKIAVFMRQWDSERGTEIECCDLRCGQYNLYKYRLPYFSKPFHMHGFKWLGIRFDHRTNPEIIFRLFEQAIHLDFKKNFSSFSNKHQVSSDVQYTDTAIPQPGTVFSYPPDTPPKIREMMSLYQLGDGSFQMKCKNFYLQGKFMENYEDDYLWTGSFKRYFPTYHDLRIDQLRGYFTWRTELRKGQFRRISPSFAYIYIYELLNQIGTSSPEDSLDKLKEFETQYVRAGFGDDVMYNLLHKWMLEFSILYDIPPETARLLANPELVQTDESIEILRNPEVHSEEEIFHSLSQLSSTKIDNSPVIKSIKERGIHLFAEIWKYTLKNYRYNDRDVIFLIFGEQRKLRFHPLGNAVYWERRQIPPKEYRLTPCRHYKYQDEIWTEFSYQSINFDKKYLNQLLHESDRRLRIYLKTGHPLKEKADEYWTVPYIDAVIESDRKAIIEASRPKVHIDFSELDQIRLDAINTRDSLLTEDEIEHEDPQPTIPDNPQEMMSGDHQEMKLHAAPTEPVIEDSSSTIALDEVHARILKMLLDDEPCHEFITSQHLMISIVADTINEALFDEIGDNVIECDGNHLTLVEDYRDDVLRLCHKEPSTKFIY